MARASDGKDRHRARQEIRRAVAAQRARESSHRRNAHRKEGGIGHSCLTFDRPDVGVFYRQCEDNMKQVEVLPATDCVASYAI